MSSGELFGYPLSLVVQFQAKIRLVDSAARLTPQMKIPATAASSTVSVWLYCGSAKLRLDQRSGGGEAAAHRIVRGAELKRRNLFWVMFNLVAPPRSNQLWAAMCIRYWPSGEITSSPSSLPAVCLLACLAHCTLIDILNLTMTILISKRNFFSKVTHIELIFRSF